jgi:hypothetical protein
MQLKKSLHQTKLIQAREKYGNSPRILQGINAVLEEDDAYAADELVE